mmetsp:Transcript_36037/g.60727  ORF Transcript_36037/g.60727 Transcript_36037/m.60727 type:complete len:118 (-) Transcript_36037:497-850(-)
MRQHLQLALLERHDTALQGRLPDVNKRHIDGILLREICLVDAVRQRSGGGLGHQAKAVKPRDLRRVKQRPALCVSGIHGAADDAVRDLSALVLLRDHLKLAQQHSHHLFSGKLALLA